VTDSPENQPGNVPPAPEYRVPPPPPYQTMGTAVPPIAAPPKQESSTMKVVLIVLAVFVAIGIGVASVAGYAIWRFSKAIHRDAKTGSMTIDTPNGPITTSTNGTVTEADLGVPIYPGATQTRGTIRVNAPTGPMVQANYLTTDSKDQVAAFYTDKMGPAAMTTTTGQSVLITWTKSRQDSVMLSIVQRPSQYDGKTQIHIMHQVNNTAK
jgi:hypothetical protein